MKILYRALYTIDLDRNVCSRKEIPEDFNDFIEDYIHFAMDNTSNKLYYVPDKHITVPNAIISIVCDQSEKADGFATTIANKLLASENAAQEKIYGMGKKIKRGSIVQAYIEDENENRLYIIAKVEHSAWYDGESLKKTFGFPSEKKNVWKSSVFTLFVDEDGIEFGNVKVFTDNEAKYWALQFLELGEERTDARNTEIVMGAVEQELKRKVRPKSESDYYNMRNTLITKLKTAQHFNYDSFVDTLTSYVPDSEIIDMDMLKSSLLKLPEAKQFDRQFETVPSAVKKRRKLSFPVRNGIEIRVDGDLPDFKKEILSEEDSMGMRYIKIKCENNETYNLFG